MFLEIKTNVFRKRKKTTTNGISAKPKKRYKAQKQFTISTADGVLKKRASFGRAEHDDTHGCHVNDLSRIDINVTQEEINCAQTLAPFGKRKRKMRNFRNLKRGKMYR